MTLHDTSIENPSSTCSINYPYVIPIHTTLTHFHTHAHHPHTLPHTCTPPSQTPTHMHTTLTLQHIHTTLTDSHTHAHHPHTLPHAYTHTHRYPFSDDQPVPECDWETYVRDTAHLIVEQQTPQRLLEVRTRLYELLTHCIPPDIIIKVSYRLSALTRDGMCCVGNMPFNDNKSC